MHLFDLFYVKELDENRTFQGAVGSLSIQKTNKPHLLRCGKTQSFFDIVHFNNEKMKSGGYRMKAASGLIVLLAGCPIIEPPTGSEYDPPPRPTMPTVYNPPPPPITPTQPPRQPPNIEISFHSTTGVPGLNTVDQIENNPRVAGVISDLERLGYNFALYSEPAIHPPNIEGTYTLTGEQETPFRGDIIPGTFHWSNQTRDNHITTNYSQFFSGLEQRGVSTAGEIIRGTGNGFTVYSIVDVSQNNGCDFRGVIIMTGEITNARNIATGLYCSAILEQDAQCGAVSAAGSFVLERE